MAARFALGSGCKSLLHPVLRASQEIGFQEIWYHDQRWKANTQGVFLSQAKASTFCWFVLPEITGQAPLAVRAGVGDLRGKGQGQGRELLIYLFILQLENHYGRSVEQGWGLPQLKPSSFPILDTTISWWWSARFAPARLRSLVAGGLQGWKAGGEAIIIVTIYWEPLTWWACALFTVSFGLKSVVPVSRNTGFDSELSISLALRFWSS